MRRTSVTTTSSTISLIKEMIGLDFCGDLPLITGVKVLADLEAQGILGGIALSAFKPELPNAILVATTELTTPSDIEKYLSAMATVMKTVKTGGDSQKQRVPVA